jgi:MFS family permease
LLNLLNKNSNTAIVIAGIISIIIGVGVARFSYTTILPSMLEQNVLSLSFSGILASTNYIGYLSGAFLAIFISNFHFKVQLFRLGMILSIFTTALFFITTDETIWTIGRIIAGFGSAMVLVGGPSIVLKKLSGENKTKIMGYYFSGIGFSILVCDLVARIVLPNWNLAWILIVFLGILLISYPYYILSFDKEDTSSKQKHPFDKTLFNPIVFILTFAYCTEGFGFVIQGTYLPTIIQSIDGLEKYSANAWMLVGIAGIPSAIIWMYFASKYGSVSMIIYAMIFQIIGILIPAFFVEPFLILLSGFLYGFTFIPLVALFINLGGIIAKNNPVVLMGMFTSAYGIGQITAPLYAVYFTELSGNYNHALYLTAFIVFLGVLALIFLKTKFKGRFND